MPSDAARCERHRGSSGWARSSSPPYTSAHYRARAELMRMVGADAHGLGGSCALCGRPGVVGDPLEADHIAPRRLGGTDTIANMRAIHHSENLRRGARLGAQVANANAKRKAGG